MVLFILGVPVVLPPLLAFGAFVVGGHELVFEFLLVGEGLVVGFGDLGIKNGNEIPWTSSGRSAAVVAMRLPSCPSASARDY